MSDKPILIDKKSSVLSSFDESKKKTNNHGASHLEDVKASLNSLLNDKRVPSKVRDILSHDYINLEAMLEKIEHGHIHIAAVGRVSVGKSSLLNALLGKEQFKVSPLHGETRQIDMSDWDEANSDGIFLVDTPGLNEIDGESREAMTRELASRSDLILFVIDSDLTNSEKTSLIDINRQDRPIIIVINKIDRYTKKEQVMLFDSVSKITEGIIAPNNIIFTCARAREQNIIVIDDDGNEVETTRELAPDIRQLKMRLWEILEEEGQMLAALNAGLFAGNFGDQLSKHILEVRQGLATKVIRTYSVGKGLSVAVNPIPIADLFAAAILDITMIYHLSRVYGLPLTKYEAGSLVRVICAQMLALIGTVWAVNIVSSSLKLGTAGMSTLVTAGGQGAIAYYSSYVVGQVAKRYFANGKSWGELGPKQIVSEILENIDRKSIIKEAKSDILSRLQQSN